MDVNNTLDFLKDLISKPWSVILLIIFVIVFSYILKNFFSEIGKLLAKRFSEYFGELFRKCFSSLFLRKVSGQNEISEGLSDYIQNEKGNVIDEKRGSVAAFVGQAERGPICPVLVNSWSEFCEIYGHEFDENISYLSYSVRGFFENGGSIAYISRVVGDSSASSELRIPTDKDNEFLVIKAQHVGDWGNRILVRVQEGTRVGFRFIVAYFCDYESISEFYETDKESSLDFDYSGATVYEEFDNLSLGSTNNIAEVICSKSNLVTAFWLNNSAKKLDFVCSLLTGGNKGTHLKSEHYIGDNNEYQKSGLRALEDIDDINIICIPDHVHSNLDLLEQEKIAGEMIEHCKKKSNRFAILSVEKNVKFITSYKPKHDTSLAALYYPWVKVVNCSGKNTVLIPPVGHIAGTYSRNDAMRGIHKSPEGLKIHGLHSEKSILNKSPLEFNISKKNLDILEKLNINPILVIDKKNNDYRAASSFTMSIDENWKHVSIVRFCQFIRSAIIFGTNWVVFEENNENVRKEVSEKIVEFMTELWKEGVLYGHSAEETFFVKVDEENNPQEVIDAGMFIVEVDVALNTEPSRSIHLSINIKMTPNERPKGSDSLLSHRIQIKKA